MANRIETVIESLSRGAPVLVSRLQYLGDVILTLPLAYAIKQRFPKCDIDYLSKRPGAELLDPESAIRAVHRVPDPGEGVAATVRLIRRLRERRFALAIDLLSNPRSAFLIWATGARFRLGGTRRVRRHLYTHTVHVPADIRSSAAHHLYYLNTLGIDADIQKPRITVSPEESRRARVLLDGLGVNVAKQKVGIHPGGKWEVKRWPVASFASLAAGLKARLGAEVVVFRGPGEGGEFTDRLRNSLGNGAAYLPELSVRDAAAVMGELSAGVYCDGGAMHLSVAVGTPTVGIFGSSEPDVWFPYERFGPFRAAYVPVACRPCHSHFCDHLTCLEGLEVEAVERLVIGVLEQGSSSAGAADSG